MEVMRMFNDKNIFITGGTGSWANELVTQLLENYKPKKVVIYSRGEHRQVEMKRHFNNPLLKFVIGDVRDKNILNMAMHDADIVFHLAALKHVPICEENCWEAVLTNIYGTQNVIECAINNGVKKVIDVSTDKAVDPFNLYGVTKACGEKLVVNAGKNYDTKTIFTCIRAGNVMGTHGSVLPLFREQIVLNNEITVTDPEMTRYLMSTKEAIGLVFKAVTKAVGGEVFVMRMSSTTVEEMANVMIEIFGNEKTKKKIIGVRPGEKKHEVLVSKNESPRTKVLDDNYFVILPQDKNSKLEDAYGNLPNISSEEFSSLNAKRLKNSELLSTLKKESWLWEKQS